MKNPTHYWLLLILLVGCGTDEKEKAIPVYTFDQGIESKPLKLSELMEDIRVVRLETTPETQLPNYFKVLLTDKKIITMDQKQIMQFSNIGKFEKVLARSGSGPDEFNYVYAQTVDRRNDMLYYQHNGDGEHIQCLNLHSGKIENRIPIPLNDLGGKGFSISSMSVINDTTLVCVPAYSLTANHKIFFMSLSGKLLGGLQRSSADGPEVNPLIKQVFPAMKVSYMPDGVHAIETFSDTMFLLTPDKRLPIAVIHLETPFDPKTMNGQFHGSIMETPNSILYEQRSLKINVTDNGYNFSDGKSNFYHILKKESKISEVSGVEADIFDFTFDIKQGNFVTQETEGILTINAPDFITQADSVLNAGTASQTVLAQLKSLSSEVKETDNPILLIGKLK